MRPADDGDRQRHRRQRRLDVRRHVVGAFSGVPHPAHRRIVRRRHEARGRIPQVAPHVRVGILLHAQRARRVLDEQREQASSTPLSCTNVARWRELVQRGPVGSRIVHDACCDGVAHPRARCDHGQSRPAMPGDEVVAAAAIDAAHEPQRALREIDRHARSCRRRDAARARTPTSRACSAARRRCAACPNDWAPRRGSCTRRAATSVPARARCRRHRARRSCRRPGAG